MPGEAARACANAQGTKPEVRTYNTIISACNRSGQPESALAVYERMLADGAQPTATTYTALISAYGKTGKVSSSCSCLRVRRVQRKHAAAAHG
jgi:pentatricopeptide repeat domain-containing protein 1